MAQFFEKLFAEGGNTFEICILGDRILATQEAENVEAVFKTKQSCKWKIFSIAIDCQLTRLAFTTAGRLHILQVLMKQSVMTQEGPAWKHTRNLMRKPLSRPQYHDLGVVRRHVDNLIALLPTNSPVNLSPLLFRFTVDTATSFLFGKSVNSLVLPRVPAEERFEKAFEYCWDYIMFRGRLRKVAWLLNERQFRKQRGVLYDYIDNVMDEASARDRKAEEERDYTKRGKTPLLDSLMQGKENREEVRDHMIFCLAAARQTTSALLTWTL